MMTLAADLTLGCLLLLTTGWCILLYRRLDRLRFERSDIEAFLSAVDTAARRAEQAIAGIRDGTAEAQRRMASENELAEQRIAELARLVETSGRMARRVEAAVHQGARAMAEDAVRRDRERAASSVVEPTPPKPPPPSPARERPPRPRLEAELRKVLEALR